ncbi:MAG TPA: hypothetical protein VFX59_15735 [Polyangiales bacterium]|nr:hypothetical protein [Polyangiales bacterium]
MAAEQAKPRGAVSEDDQLSLARGETARVDAPYAGVLGRTRNEAVQVLMPDGSLRSVSVYVGIDADEDPALAALARAGQLHHVAEGVELALPFVYHDARARIFVLVVPEGLRHRALALRAEAMAQLAGDTQHAVPAYVRDVELVVGPRELTRRLETGRVGLALPRDDLHAQQVLLERERLLEARERLLDARERALHIHQSDIEEIDEPDDALYEPGEAENVGELEEVEEIDDEEDLEDDEDEDFADADDDAISFDPALAPPIGTTVDPSVQLWLSAADGQVWLFVRGRPSQHRQDAEMELLVQLDPAREVPVVTVSLVFDVNGSPEVRRGVVDPFAPEEREALYVLAEHFEVGLVAVSTVGGLQRSEHIANLHSPRESNVRAILGQLERLGEQDRDVWLATRDAVLASPPPWRDLTHPFQPDRQSDAPLTATEAAVLLDELGDWLSPERQARVRMLLCVPDEVVDASYRAGIGHALDWGLSLTPELAARALELGIAQDETALLQRRIEGLCRISREADLGGLSPSVLRSEWSKALEQAARLGVGLREDARELAAQHAGERALLHAAALSDARDESLDPVRIKARELDREALETLIAKGGYRDVLEACRLAHRLTPEELGALFAQLARRVDPVALDAALTMLSFSEPLLVRAGAALALASRRALNALDDLAVHVAREAEGDFPLFALALGRYGAGSFRAIARALSKHAVASERAALVYAHLSLHGARAQVRAKARAREVSEAALAERALSLASDLKDGKNPAGGLEQQGSLTVFSETFDRLGRETAG